ncbi:MAG: hypothetical protein M1822_009802 [Bathelium mastoideum]|nr:MAG: hypothetical protein M1822_009802 [Bathelium mastoideum]
MKRYHRQKRLTDGQRQANFCQVTAESIVKKRTKREATGEKNASRMLRDTMAVETFDPFDSFAADTSELPKLLDHPLARQAGEPVINFSSQTGFQGLRTVFRSSLADPALLNAILLTLTFAVIGNPESAKFLAYKGETLRWVNQQLQDPEIAAAPATIGAILLLVGIEARLNNPKSIQMHMNGVIHLMKQSSIRHGYLHDGIKRAVFWQDLICAVLTGSTRAIDHETFVELIWRRDPLLLPIFQVPEGFVRSADLLGSEFLSIVRDIRALQAIRDATDVDYYDSVTIMRLDNHQASIESRLYNLGKDPMRFENPALYCCIVAAHICTYMLFTEVWSASVVPSFLTRYLMEILQCISIENLRVEHWSLFAWVICTGATFVGPGSKQTEYALMLQRHLELAPPPLASDKLHVLLPSFIWSEKTYSKRWAQFLTRYRSVIFKHIDTDTSI